MKENKKMYVYVYLYKQYLSLLVVIFLTGLGKAIQWALRNNYDFA